MKKEAQRTFRDVRLTAQFPIKEGKTPQEIKVAFLSLLWEYALIRGYSTPSTPRSFKSWFPMLVKLFQPARITSRNLGVLADSWLADEWLDRDLDVESFIEATAKGYDDQHQVIVACGHRVARHPGHFELSYVAYVSRKATWGKLVEFLEGLGGKHIRWGDATVGGRAHRDEPEPITVELTAKEVELITGVLDEFGDADAEDGSAMLALSAKLQKLLPEEKVAN